MLDDKIVSLRELVTWSNVRGMEQDPTLVDQAVEQWAAAHPDVNLAEEKSWAEWQKVGDDFYVILGEIFYMTRALATPTEGGDVHSPAGEA